MPNLGLSRWAYKIRRQTAPLETTFVLQRKFLRAWETAYRSFITRTSQDPAPFQNASFDARVDEGCLLQGATRKPPEMPDLRYECKIESLRSQRIRRSSLLYGFRRLVNVATSVPGLFSCSCAMSTISNKKYPSESERSVRLASNWTVWLIVSELQLWTFSGQIQGRIPDSKKNCGKYQTECYKHLCNKIFKGSGKCLFCRCLFVIGEVHR